MLDQADFIARYDKHDALGVIAGMARQLGHDFPVPAGLEELGEIHQVVLAGMGGSAQPGEFIKTWLGDQLKVPFVVVRDYTLPAFVGPNTLVVASSYSGNTEETLAATAEAQQRGAKIAVVTAGGKLLDMAKAKGYPHLVVPGGIQPRMAVLYAVRAWVTLLEGAGLVKGALNELAAAGKWLESQTPDWEPGVATPHNAAKQIASELVGHPAVVYAGPTLSFAAMKWKIALNENAKHIAFYNYLPEFNHNEFIGWSHPERSGLKVVELQSNLDLPQIQKRFEVSNRLLSSAFAPIEVHAVGETKLQQLVWTILLGEYVATYLACLNGIDPTPVDLVEKLKTELA